MMTAPTRYADKDLVDDLCLAQLTRKLWILAHPVCLKILAFLHRADMTVGELVETIGVSRFEISKHLRWLKDAGFATKSGQRYSVHIEMIQALFADVLDYICVQASAS